MMIPRSLVQMIEDHCESISGRIVRSLRADALLPHMGELPESELRDRACEVINNLGHWLVPGQESEIARRYDALGRRRNEEGIPLQEVVKALHTIKDNMLDHVREQGLGHSAMEMYAEEQLEQRVNRFFDVAVYHVVCGYQEAKHRPAHTSP
jgi:hypothetical protein